MPGEKKKLLSDTWLNQTSENSETEKTLNSILVEQIFNCSLQPAIMLLSILV